VRLSVSNLIHYVLVGVCIGLVDLVPGVSGGTLAFVFGLWERLLSSLALLTSAFGKLLKLSFVDAKNLLIKVDWLLVLPVGFGVVLALFFGASLIGVLFDSHEQLLRAFFFGLVLGALPVPFRQIDHWNVLNMALLLVGFSASFLLSSIPPPEAFDPPSYFIFLGASVSICATILPGLSGSFILLLLGLYEPFINAIRERDVLTLGMFILGSWFGLLLFVSRVRWLLNHYRNSVLSVLSGMMLGGVRVLWPWQGESGALSQFTDFGSLFQILFCLTLGLMGAVLINKFSNSTK